MKTIKIHQSHFTVIARNGKVVLTSENYETASGILKGIHSVIRNAQLPEAYNLLTAKDGRYYFTLRAGNNKVIGTSQMYRTKFGRWVGMRAVKKYTKM